MRSHFSQATCGMAVALFALAVLGCGGDNATAPSPPDVSGLYQSVTVAEVATCVPASALDVLELVLGSGTVNIKLRVTQQGGQVTTKELEVEGQNVEDQNVSATGTIDRDGAVRLETQRSDQFVLGGRTFFDQASTSAAGRFDRAAHPITFTLTGTATQVFREGSSTAPVFATCTQSETATGTWTSS